MFNSLENVATCVSAPNSFALLFLGGFIYEVTISRNVCEQDLRRNGHPVFTDVGRQLFHAWENINCSAPVWRPNVSISLLGAHRRTQCHRCNGWVVKSTSWNATNWSRWFDVCKQLCRSEKANRPACFPDGRCNLVVLDSGRICVGCRDGPGLEQLFHSWHFSPLQTCARNCTSHLRELTNHESCPCLHNMCSSFPSGWCRNRVTTSAFTPILQTHLPTRCQIQFSTATGVWRFPNHHLPNTPSLPGVFVDFHAHLFLR